VREASSYGNLIICSVNPLILLPILRLRASEFRRTRQTSLVGTRDLGALYCQLRYTTKVWPRDNMLGSMHAFITADGSAHRDA
jgi:hypothetical protein